MQRIAALTAVTAALTLALSGCGVSNPSGTPTPLAPPTSAAASPTPSASPSASPSPTPSSSPSAAAVVLAGTGIAGQKFGAPQAGAEAILTARLGKPNSKTAGQGCELDPSSTWVNTLVYGDLWVQFEAKDSKKTSPRTLSAWGYRLGKPLPSTMTMADNVPLNLTFTELKAKYAGTKDLKLGVPGVTAVQLPNKVIFTGGKKPEVVQAGSISVCE